MFSLLPLRVLYFLCYVEVSLDSKLEPIFLKKSPEDIFKAYCVGWTIECAFIFLSMGKCNLILSKNLTILSF